MTKDLLRWEDSPGLEHHCPKCQTPLNNPRAKHTCYFKHVEICPLFHQHFFLIGQAHNCDTCRRNNTAHDQRHRHLAQLLRQLSQLQQDHGLEPTSLPDPPFSPSGKTNPTPSTTEAIKSPEPTPKLKKRDRKKAKKRIKALKGGDALTPAEVERVAAALHPPGRSNSASSASSADTAASDATAADDSEDSVHFAALIQANKSFCADVDGRLNSARMRLQTALLSVLDETTSPVALLVDNAMQALGVADVDARTPKPVAEMVVRVKEAVYQDLFCWDCDQKKFRLRQAGWYRFVNRSVLALREQE